jgi:lipopolysaccharide/colanic/teichoic acid biosynthesis glycosyltransferase
MEEEHIIIPFNVNTLHVNLIKYIYTKVKKYTKAVLKRFFEIIISFIGIIFLIPFTILIFIRRWINRDKCKIFRVQEKIGKNGKIFKMYTFNYNGELKYLKKSCLYHLPEIINIFLGDMTFVGPKAYNVEQKEKMGEYYSYIILHKPGITGLVQISRSSKNNFDERLDLDLKYHYKQSFLYNMKIIFITLLITLKNNNAYKVSSQINRSINDIKTLISEFIKRIIDIIAGGLGIIFLIPIIIFVKIASICLREKGSIFYTQERIGKDGKNFKIYKFRSMVKNADEILEELLEKDEEAAREFKLNKKLKNDPRLTKLGRFLRRTSIDELPQVINVFKGDMSLVGPRPYLPREKEDMGGYYDYIIRSKPGITGLWQVNGRSNTTFDKRIWLDRQYNREKSLKTDAKILLKTVTCVFRGEGAE